MKTLFTIRIDIPALDALVAYLTARDQETVDALTAQVKDFTGRLAKSSSELKGSVEAERQKEK